MRSVTDDEWLALLHRCASGEDTLIDGRPLPPMPDRQLQINTVGQAGEAAMQEAWTFASQCLVRFRKSPLFGDPQKVLLDFGTGWGRIARCFLRDVAAENIIGVDVSPDLLSVCRETFPGPRFLQGDPFPPLPLAGQSVHFVVGYSVFSHLSEAACRAWTAEFARLLKPGGMAALTTRGRWFFDYAASLKGSDAYSLGLARMFADFEAAKALYDSGAIVHSNADGVSGGGPLDKSFYGETFIPEGFAQDALGSILPLAEFYRGDGHPILFFRKPAEH